MVTEDSDGQVFNENRQDYMALALRKFLQRKLTAGADNGR